MRAVIASIVVCGLAAPTLADESGRTVVADPSLAFGEWNERVQLDLPPAANGTKPDVAIVAAHRAVDTEVGSGWRLQAGSVIRRRSLSNGIPSTSTDMSKSLFHLDGVELVKVALPVSGHYQPETYDGSRIEYVSASNTWTRKRDGWTWTYGGNGTRYIHTDPFQPDAPCTATGLCNTESWFLQSVVDSNGNRIDYTYDNADTPSRYTTQYGNHSKSKDFLISRITYGGTNAASISFTYEPRPDTNVDMSGGMPAFRHRRLKKITSTVGPSATATRYSQYVLQYEDEAGTETDIGTLTDCNNISVTTLSNPMHSLLRKIHRTATGKSRVIRCNKFHHEDIEFESGQPVPVIANPFTTSPFVPTDNSWKMIPAELDGDGRTDLIMLAYGARTGLTPHRVYVATPNRPDPFVAAGAGSIASQTAQSWQNKLTARIASTVFTGRKGHAIVDIDQDSIPELITEGAATAIIEKAQGTGVLTWSPLGNSLANCDLRYGEFNDVDGDRMPDLIVRAHDSDTACPREAHTRWIKNNGAAPYFDSATAVDLRLPLESMNGPQIWQTAVSACPGGVVGPPVDFRGTTWSAEAYVADQVRFDDVNSDGVMDAAWALYACWTAVDGRWQAVPNSSFSRIYFGKGDGLFTDSGLTAGPPLLLDMRDWGGLDETRITPGTFAMADLDRDGRAELVSSASNLDGEGLGITASKCASFEPVCTAASCNDPWEVGFGIRQDQLLNWDHQPRIASFAGTAWDCHQRTVVPVWGDFDGDGFVDVLTVEGNGTGTGFWLVTLRRNDRDIAEGRMIETDNEHGGRTRLTWGFSAQLPNANPYLAINAEVIQEVMGPGGTRSMTYRDGAQRGDQMTAFAEVTVRGDRGGTEVYSFTVSPYAMAKQFMGVRYRENAVGSVEHVTVLLHGQMTSIGLVANLGRPYFNPLVRKCEFDTGFSVVNLDTLAEQCRAHAWLAPNTPAGPVENTVTITAHNLRLALGHDRSPDDATERALYAKVWGVGMGSRVAAPRIITTPVASLSTTFLDAFTQATLPPTPGIYWPVPSVLQSKIPDVIGQEATYAYPGIAIGATKSFIWDWAYNQPVRKLLTRYEHRDLATTADDLRVDFTWEQPQSTGYWYRLLTETTSDNTGVRLAGLERADFHTTGFDAPKTIRRCGRTTPNDCSVDKYTYNANGTLLTHTLPDGTSESWTRAWCGEPLTHSDPASRVTTFTRDANCLPLTVGREGATTTFTRDHFLRPLKTVADPGAGVSTSKLTHTYYYDDALTYQTTVDAREDWSYQEPRQAVRRGDGQLELVYQDGLGRTTRRTRCADTGTNTTGGSTGDVACASTTRRHLEWNLYGNDGLRKIATAPFADGETPTTTAYGHDGQGRVILILEPVHEPSLISWRIDQLKYLPGQQDRIEPTASGTVTTRHTLSTLSESIGVAGITRNTITRNRLGLITKIVEADGTATALAYDDRYRLLTETRVNAFGQPLQQNVVGSDGVSRLASYIHTIAARDARDRVITELMTDGSKVEYTYDNADRILTRKVNDTLVRRLAYTAPSGTAKGKVVATDELGGMAATTTFDGLGRTWSRTASRVNDAWTYDIAGRRITSTDIDGLQTRYFYDIHDTLTSTVDPRTGTTTYNRDGAGRPTSIVDADGATESFQYVYSGALFRRYRGTWLLDERDYDPQGQIVNSIEDGVAKAMTYDVLGRVTRIREGNGLRTSDFTYDAGDRVSTIVRSPVAGILTSTTTFQYDGWGRPYAVDDPSGRVSREFDLAGRVRRITDQEAAVIETKYDGFGRVTDKQIPGRGWQHFAYAGKQTYNAEPNLWRIDQYDDVQGSGQRIQRYLDGTGHTVAELRPDGTSTRWTWNKARVTREEIRNGATVHRAIDYAYDANGRLAQETRGNYIVSHAYTTAGRPFRTTTPDDMLQREYTHGLLSAETQAGVTHTYKRDASKTWITQHDMQRGSSPTRTSAITRDALGRITTTRTNDGAAAEVVASYTQYDFYGNPWLEQRTIGNSNVVEAWSYDRKGRPLRRHVSGTGLVGNETIWGWYSNDVLAAVQTPTSRVIEYDYGAGPTFDHTLDRVTLDGVVVAQVDSRDARGAITQLTLPAPINKKRTFAYDVLGRTVHRSSGPTGPATPDLEWDVAFHPDGKIRTELVQDNAGLDSWENVYTYDAAGRLTREVSGKTGTTLDYVLDAAGNRTTTIPTPTSQNYAAMTATYEGPKLTKVNNVAILYNNWNEVSTDHHGNIYSRNADGELAALTRPGKATVFARNARNLPIAAVESVPGDNVVGTRRTAWQLSAAGLPIEVREADNNILTYIEVDGIHVGTAVDGVMTNVVADHKGSELAHGNQVFGNPTAFGAATTAPNNSEERFMFAMLERVPSANEVMLARRRTYDPITGRFLEPDPIGAAGGLELYQYGNGDPVNFVDPMGTTPVAIGESCATGGAAPVIHFDPIRTQTHEMMGQNAAASMDDLMASSGLAQNAYVTGLIAGQKWITGLDLTSTNNPFSKGPLCVVNCGTTSEEPGQDDTDGPDGYVTINGVEVEDVIVNEKRDDSVEEIIVIGKRIPPRGGGSGCTSDCDDDEEPLRFRRESSTPIGGSNLATAFSNRMSNSIEKKAAGHAMVREALAENVKARADAFAQVAANVWEAGPLRLAGAAAKQVITHPIDTATAEFTTTKDAVVAWLVLPGQMPSLVANIHSVETEAEAAEVAEQTLGVLGDTINGSVVIGGMMTGAASWKALLTPDIGDLAKLGRLDLPELDTVGSTPRGPLDGKLGRVLSVPNENGGHTVVTQGRVTGAMLYEHLDDIALSGRPLVILTSTHGHRGWIGGSTAGRMSALNETRFYLEDVARYGNGKFPNVRIRDVTRMSDEQIRMQLQSGDAVCTAWCDSVNTPIVHQTLGTAPTLPRLRRPLLD